MELSLLFFKDITKKAFEDLKILVHFSFRFQKIKKNESGVGMKKKVLQIFANV